MLLPHFSKRYLKFSLFVFCLLNSQSTMSKPTLHSIVLHFVHQISWLTVSNVFSRSMNTPHPNSFLSNFDLIFSIMLIKECSVEWDLRDPNWNWYNSSLLSKYWYKREWKVFFKNFTYVWKQWYWSIVRDNELWLFFVDGNDFG